MADFKTNSAPAEKVGSGRGNGRGNGKHVMDMELVASMKAPASIVAKIKANEKGMLDSIKACDNEPKTDTNLGITLREVLKAYNAEAENGAGLKANGTYNPGGRSINYERSNLYPASADNETLLRKGRPNPSILTNKYTDKSGQQVVVNTDYLRITDTNLWPSAVLDQPVSLEFPTAKRKPNAKPDAPMTKDYKSDNVSVVFRVKANAHIITKDEIAKAKAEQVAHPEYSVKSGLTVYNNSIKPSDYPSFQGMGKVQYENSAYLRKNVKAAADLGNEHAGRHYAMLLKSQTVEVTETDSSVDVVEQGGK